MGLNDKIEGWLLVSVFRVRLIEKLELVLCSCGGAHAQVRSTSSGVTWVNIKVLGT